ncbi:caspase-3-like [Scleropages formosus]|uniref:caspase-3-like n=1 Tax=Scleropages formosus TaxID=113540 RepID=UPI0010FA9E33|nr:caspase-3-like [Scleropages formosus]
MNNQCFSESPSAAARVRSHVFVGPCVPSLTCPPGPVSREDHSERSCFVCVVLSHGDEGHILGTDGKAVPVGKLSATLTARRCPSLWGKPKLFFVQACRGQEYDCGVQTDSVVEREPCVTFCEAPEEDFLCGYSTPPGNLDTLICQQRLGSGFKYGPVSGVPPMIVWISCECSSFHSQSKDICFQVDQ